MKRILVCSAVLAAVFMGGRQASASIVSSYLTFDGPINHTIPVAQGGGEDALNDESRSKFADNGDGKVSAGDIIFGMSIISDVSASGRPQVNLGTFDQIAVVFSFMLTGTGSGAGGSFTTGDIINLAPVANSGNAHDLRNLLSADIVAAASLSDQSVFAVVASADGTAEGGTDPIDFNQATAEGDLKEFNGANSFGDSWLWQATGGIVSATDFSQFLLINLGSFLGNQTGGFTLTSSTIGGTLLSVDVAHFNNTVTYHDVTLPTASVNISPDGPWSFVDQATFLVNPTPEPASLAIWAGLAAGIGFVRARRKK